MTHPHPRRRQRRAVGPVVDPAAGRPARPRRPSPRCASAASTPPSRSSSCASTPATWPTTSSPGSRTRACATALDTVAGADGADRRHADLLRVLQRPVQDLLRRPGHATRSPASRCSWARPAGTARHSLALEHAMRPLFAYLRAVVAPTAVFAASEDWGGGDATEPRLVERIDRAAGELADLVAQRAAGGSRPTRSPTPRRSRRCCAAPDRPRPVVSAARPNRPRRCFG